MLVHAKSIFNEVKIEMAVDFTAVNPKILMTVSTVIGNQIPKLKNCRWDLVVDWLYQSTFLDLFFSFIVVLP